MIFSRIADRLLEKRVAAYQDDLIEKHFEEVQSIYDKMRGWRHDYHNHIQALLALVGDDERTRDYLWKLNKDLTEVDTVVKTGNVTVDAILNSKLTLIKSKDIPVDAVAKVPDDLKISEIDLCAIIGNLLDNAIEAVLPLPPESRFIRIYIGMLKSQLYISVTNSTASNPAKSVKNMFPPRARAGEWGLCGWTASLAATAERLIGRTKAEFLQPRYC